MSIRFDIPTLDAADSRGLATFWAHLLDLVLLEDEDDGRWLLLGTPAGRRVLGIQRSSESASRSGSLVAMVGPDKPRMHLDLQCELREFEEKVAWLTSIGAVLRRRIRTETYGRIANFTDPEGHLFDLCAYLVPKPESRD